jgi:hypothetical protein
MVVKIAKAVWFVSLLGALAALLLIYASLPEQVVVLQEQAKLVSLPRDTVFYSALVLMTIANVLVFVAAKTYPKNNAFRTWFYIFMVTLNIFFIVALNLLNVFNGSEHFNYKSVDFMIYGSVILVALWAVSWPFYFVYRKISHKQTV